MAVYRRTATMNLLMRSVAHDRLRPSTATDPGQPKSPLRPTDCWRSTKGLIAQGISGADIEQSSQTNPAKVLAETLIARPGKFQLSILGTRRGQSIFGCSLSPITCFVSIKTTAANTYELRLNA